MSIIFNDCAEQLAALHRSQAVIEFKLDGTILRANQNFLDLLGYRLEEVVGRHHEIFVDPREKGAGYQLFWDRLRSGVFQAAEFRRIKKTGEAVWIQATYNPIRGKDGKPFKVVKYAVDITAQKTQNAEFAAQIDAIGKVMAVIEFQPDGTVITANDNFLKVLGYGRLSDIQGRHHEIFVAAADKASANYRAFWDALGRGEYQTAEYRRVTRDGRDVFIQASYNPILDTNGKVYKIVKFATDITAAVHDRTRKADAQKSIDADLECIAQAVSMADEQLGSASSASVQTSGNVSSVAAASEELVQSITEISRSVTEASRVTGLAVEQGRIANHLVESLSETADKIGAMVGLVNSIASQTNLLALNATIEAARAGEAGKGFAVVAAEVKNLASQTAKATQEITAHVAAAQSATSETIAAIKQITATVDNINGVSMSIASAVEEQGSVTQEIATNMQTAAEGVNLISENIKKIAAATRNAAASARKVKEASRALMA